MVENSRDYELLTRRVMADLLGLAPASLLEHDVKVQGKATAHQIDVLWEAPADFGGPVTVLFECKKHARRIEQKDLMAFRTVVDDVAAVRGATIGVFVVSSGYQSGAVNIASTYGIVILELREPRPSDLRGRVTDIDLTLKVQIPVITDWEIVASDESAKTDTAFRVSTDQRLVLADGRTFTLAEVVCEGVLDGFDEVQPQRIKRDFPSPANLLGTGIQIHSVSATVGAESFSENHHIGGAERFSLVLNATIPGASAFVMEDGQMRGDVETLRALLTMRDPDLG